MPDLIIDISKPLADSITARTKLLDISQDDYINGILTSYIDGIFPLIRYPNDKLLDKVHCKYIIKDRVMTDLKNDFTKKHVFFKTDAHTFDEFVEFIIYSFINFIRNIGVNEQQGKIETREI